MLPRWDRHQASGEGRNSLISHLQAPRTYLCLRAAHFEHRATGRSNDAHGSSCCPPQIVSNYFQPHNGHDTALPKGETHISRKRFGGRRGAVVAARGGRAPGRVVSNGKLYAGVSRARAVSAATWDACPLHSPGPAPKSGCRSTPPSSPPPVSADPPAKSPFTSIASLRAGLRKATRKTSRGLLHRLGVMRPPPPQTTVRTPGKSRWRWPRRSTRSSRSLPADNG